jgi:hypothetical protein
VIVHWLLGCVAGLILGWRAHEWWRERQDRQQADRMWRAVQEGIAVVERDRRALAAADAQIGRTAARLRRLDHAARN